MTQADSVLSTPPTNTSATRRKILGTIAIGTVAALASTIAEPGAIALPAGPIYAAIEKHRQSYAVMQAVFAEHRQAHELADAKVGPAHLDIPSMAEPGESVRAVCWWDIERPVPREQYPDLCAHHNAVLDERKAAHAAIVESLIGDEDEATNELSHAEFKALQEFAGTMPTTLSGLLAMIVYAGECSKNDGEAFADRDCPLIETLATAAKAIAQVQS
jgi:hypothetical protein